MNKRRVILTISILINALTLIIAFATHFGTVVILTFCLSAVSVLYGLFINNKKILKFINITIAFLCVMFIAFNIFIYNYGKTDNADYNEDAIIILGAGVNKETPSLILASRLNAALDYYAVNPNVIIVVSGGKGSGEDISEALAMERYLVKRGITKEKIVKEENATTTRENIKFSKRLLDQCFDKPYKTVIVTNDFHVFRSIIIAEANGLESTHIHAGIPKYSIPANYLRETIAILFQVLFS